MMKHVVCFLALCALAFADDTSDRVKGGSYAAAGEFPHQASVWHNNRHICGGALITRKHVVTSASCMIHFIRNPSSAINLQILVGTIDQTRDGILYNVAKIVVHPEYKWSATWASYENDIVVIHLTDYVEESRFVRQANLPGITELPQGADLIFSGWGGISPNASPVRYLVKARLRYISTEECQRYFPGKKIKMYQLCTAPNSYVGTCSTDIGGPLMYGDALVGISTGQTACGSGLPDVFTKVSYYLKFLIDETSSY